MRRRALLEAVTGLGTATTLGIGAVLAAFSSTTHPIAIINRTDTTQSIRVRAQGAVFGIPFTRVDVEYELDPSETIDAPVVSGIHKLIATTSTDRDTVVLDGGMGQCTVHITGSGVGIRCAV